MKYGVPPKCRKIECVVSDMSSSESGEEPETNFESEKSLQGVSIKIDAVFIA